MTPSEIIASARYALNDTAVTYRQSDAELLSYVNDGMREISSIRPEQFSVVGDHICTTSQCEQNFSANTAQSVLQVISIKNSTALTPFDMSSMDTFNPSWKADTPAAATQWTKYPGDPLRFFVYPAAPASAQTLSVLYVKIPATLLIGDAITEVPLAMQVALIYFTISAAIRKDDEHSVSGAATTYYQQFIAALKGGVTA